MAAQKPIGCAGPIHDARSIPSKLIGFCSMGYTGRRMPSGEVFGAAERLHSYLRSHHYQSGVLRGPDAGVRLNLRLWRFLKSGLDRIEWRDDYVFIQTQGYWILSNLRLF